MASRFRRPRRGLPALALSALGAGLFPLLMAPRPALAQQSPLETPGAKGAQVYCFMRSNGNDHTVSWAAAYALIKRQSAGMFRTSPEHAAVMITEAVVQNPATYPECGRFIGDLFKRPVNGAVAETTPAAVPSGNGSGSTGMTRSERYAN